MIRFWLGWLARGLGAILFLVAWFWFWIAMSANDEMTCRDAFAAGLVEIEECIPEGGR